MLNQANNIFFVGIKGVAMANLAIILKKLGKDVTGSDVKEEFITDQLLKKSKVFWQTGFEPKKITKNTDLVIYSAAHQGDMNPQVIKAKKLGVKVISQARLLGELTKLFKTTIAVCGCHGKTTTSSLLSYALIKLGTYPSYLVGSSNFNEFPGGDFNSQKYFVIEADEYGVNPPYDLTPKFHHLNPDLILCTNIDFDHPDVYKNLDEVKKAYLKFFANKKLVLCADDPPTLQSINRLKSNQYLTFGFSDKADISISTPKFFHDGSSFTLFYKQKKLGVFKLSLFGEKNILNAAGVVLTLLQLGFDPKKIKTAIKGFTGAKRRFELIYSKNGIYLFDDYAHHPKEIETTIFAARSRFPGKRIVLIFQPHTYSRTQTLLKDFTKSLSLADYSYVLPIFPSARENKNNFKVKSQDISKINPQKIKAVNSKKELLNLLTTNYQPLTTFITMGAGDVYKLKDDIIEIISKI